MAKNETTNFGSEPSETEITDLNLGIKRPLLTHKPLGQKLISPKTLMPIGAKALSNSDTQVQNSPFVSESKPKHLNKSNLSEVNKVTKSTNIQHKSENNNLTIDLSQTEAITPTNVNSTIIQAKREIPQLPKALKKISNYRPISQSSVANKIDSEDIPHSVPISSTPTYQIQKAPVQDIPDSWSSIAEFFGETQVDGVSQTTVIQALKDKQQRDNLTPLQHIRTLKNHTSKQVIQASPKTSNSAESIEENGSNLSTDEDSASKEELENLDTLAREVYKMLKRRLAIESERRGNNYSGRLSW